MRQPGASVVDQIDGEVGHLLLHVLCDRPKCIRGEARAAFYEP